MATQFTDPNDPDNQKQKANTAAVPQGDPAYAPLASYTQPTPASGSAPKAANSSGQFNSFDRLLNANQGVGQSIANRLVSGANQTANAANNTLNTDVSTFNTAVHNGTPQASATQTQSQYTGPGTNLSYGAPVTGHPAGLGASTVTMGGGPFGTGIPVDAATAATVAQTAADPASYNAPIASLQNQLLNANYTGPTSANGYFDDGTAAISNAVNQLQGLGTTTGRQAQLGDSLLDAILAGSQGGQQLQQAARGAGALTNNLTNALTNAGTNLTSANTATTNLQNQIKTNLNNTTAAQNNATANAQAVAAGKQQQQLLDSQYQQYQSSKPWWYFSGPASGITQAQFGSLTPAQQAFLASGGAFTPGTVGNFGNQTMQQILASLNSGKQ